MTKPKNLTPEQGAAWREKRREYARLWYEANAEKIAEKKRLRYEANAEKERERVRRWNEANADKHLARRRRWLEANPEKNAEYMRRQRDEITPSYIASSLHLSVSQLTPKLYALKREQLLNTRALRELKVAIKEVTK